MFLKSFFLKKTYLLILPKKIQRNKMKHNNQIVLILREECAISLQFDIILLFGAL